MLDWKIKNQLLEMTTVDQNGSTVAVISIDPKSGEIVHSGTNYSGASITGQWDFGAEGGPKLNANFISSEGDEGSFNMQFALKDNDAMVFKVGTQRTSNIPMIRKQ